MVGACITCRLWGYRPPELCYKTFWQYISALISGSMPYTYILKRLLDGVEGAVGVGFVDREGETIQLEGQLEDYSHRVHLAYQGILVQNLRQIHQKDSFSWLISVHQRLTVVVKPLKNAYFLVLTLEHRKDLHKALMQLEDAAQELNQEL